jgi:hypothetical protein
VDLAAFPFGVILHMLNEQGKSAFYVSLAMKHVADAAFMKQLNAVEDVLMVGYPNALWDAKNNLPIVRRGITATPPYIDFEGRSEFVIDCACFPGSSGSPVVLFNPTGYMTKDGGTAIGSGRIKLLGVLWGGPQHTAEGEIRVVPVPTATQSIALSRIPNNLGFCIKAEQLLWFERHFGRITASEESGMETAPVGTVA